MKENIKPIPTENKKIRGKRIFTHVVFLALPILCIFFVSFWGFTGYICGRLSRHIPIVVCMIYPVAVILMILCFFASIARLIYAWRKCTWARRMLIITEICLPIVFVALLIMPMRL